jgi:hypothetical protein
MQEKENCYMPRKEILQSVNWLLPKSVMRPELTTAARPGPDRARVWDRGLTPDLKTGS